MNDLIYKEGVPFNKDGFMLFSSGKLQQCISYSRKNKCLKCIISYYGAEGEKFHEDDLSALNGLEIKELIIVFYGHRNFEAINNLKSLERLEITSDPVNTIIDFARLPNLKAFKGYYTAKLVNLFSCNNLKELTLWKFKSKTLDLEELKQFRKLTSLDIIQSNIRSLAGVEHMQNLTRLSLAYCKNLESLTNSNLHVEELEIESCKSISLISLYVFVNLKRLSLINNGEYSTFINLLDSLPKLQYFNFSQTSLIDGDNGYLLNHPSLKQMFFLNKRNYKHSCEQINQFLKSKKVI